MTLINEALLNFFLHKAQVLNLKCKSGEITHIWVFGREITTTQAKKKKCLSDLFKPSKIFKHQVYIQIPGLLKSQGEMELKNKIIGAKGEELSFLFIQTLSHYYFICEIQSSEACWPGESSKEIYKWKITRLFLRPINPAHQYPVALETEHKRLLL